MFNSIEEVNKMLEGKLDNSNGYTGAVFTSAHKTKLDVLRPGNCWTNAQNEPISQVEGYV